MLLFENERLTSPVYTKIDGVTGTWLTVHHVTSMSVSQVTEDTRNA